MNLSRRNVYLFDFFVLFILIPTEEAYRYRAVTNFEGINDFYKSVKTQRNLLASSSESDDRKQLCKQILNHPYFETRNVMWLDPEKEEDRHEILKNESYISSVIFKKWKRPRKYCPMWCYQKRPEHYEKLMRVRYSMWHQFYDEKPEGLKNCISWCRYKSTEYSYVNIPVDRTVAIGNEENRTESVFLCPVLLANRKIGAYYVSENDYDMNEATSSEDIIEFIPGRFIFAPEDIKTSSKNTSSKEKMSSATMSIVALVEDTARLSVSQIEEFYLNRDLNQTPAEHEEDDPVCTLEDANKLRLCSSILNSEVLDGQVEFSSINDSVIYACAKKQISFRSENVVNDNLLEQWMVGCRARSSDGSSRLLYVSRGYHVNSAYLYYSPNGDEDVVFLYQYYINVSVL